MNNRNFELEHSHFSQLFSRGFCIHHAGLEHHWINLQGGLFHYGFPADRMEKYIKSIDHPFYSFCLKLLEENQGFLQRLCGMLQWEGFFGWLLGSLIDRSLHIILLTQLENTWKSQYSKVQILATIVVHHVYIMPVCIISQCDAMCLFCVYWAFITCALCLHIE